MLTRLKNWIRNPVYTYDIDEFYDERTLYRVYSYLGGLFTIHFFVDRASGHHCALHWSRYMPYEAFETYCFLSHIGRTLQRLDLYEEPRYYNIDDMAPITSIINEHAKRKPIDGL